MKIKKIIIRDFRNIRELSLEPDSALNYIVGENGQGKTSILEAVSVLSKLQSFRSHAPEEWIHREFKSFSGISQLECDLTGVENTPSQWNTKLQVMISGTDLGTDASRARKTGLINGKKQSSVKNYLKQRFLDPHLGFHVITFNPSDHDLVRGEPGSRRNYLNHVLSAENFEYLDDLLIYQKILQQRNALLKWEKGIPFDLLKDLTHQLIEIGARLTLQRLKWLQRMSERIQTVLRHIAPNQEVLWPVYLSSWMSKIKELQSNNNALGTLSFSGHYTLPSIHLLIQALHDRFFELKENEVLARTTLVGPHRDDWQLVYPKGSLKELGSQGEIRSALLALKLSEIDLFSSFSGVKPVLLLDDFSSELDRERRGFLESFLLSTELQVLITTTEELPYRGKRFKISKGAMESWQGPGLGI